MADAKQYADRDHMAQGDYYLRHISAMTGEGLHLKSAIAGELAHRDMVIDAQAAEIERLRQDAERWRYSVAIGGNQVMNWIDVYDDWDGDGEFVAAIDAAMKEDNRG